MLEDLYTNHYRHCLQCDSGVVGCSRLKKLISQLSKTNWNKYETKF